MTYNERNLPDAPWVREAEAYGMPDTTDAWERDDPDWGTICDLIEEWWTDELPDFVRDYIEGDGDLMVEVYEAGLLADYINPAVKMDDPDTEWNEVDRAFTEEWENDTLMTNIWYWLDNKHKRRIVRGLMAGADTNGLRELYNEEKGEEE